MRVFVGISVVIALAMIGVGLANNGDTRPVPADPQLKTPTSPGEAAATPTPAPTIPVDNPTGGGPAGNPSNNGRELDEDRCFYGASNAQSPLAGHLIVLDPGHGDEDLGTVNMTFELNESDLVLRISDFLKDRLVASGADVCLTRTDDVYIELAERSAFANEQEGDVFVSLHLNSLPDPSNSYSMTMWGVEAKDRFLAERLLETLRYELATPESFNGDPNPMDPEVYRIEFLDSYMLQSAEMPAVLAEATFLSAAWEAQAFLDGINDGSYWREHQVADALHAGLEDYFEAFQ
jgi:N-acetylmuramoyl-L-alanine amidase